MRSANKYKKLMKKSLQLRGKSRRLDTKREKSPLWLRRDYSNVMKLN
jgi:hypothetical protein